MSTIFISYKREERDRARALANAFEASALPVWWDPEIRAGEHFDDVIEQRIRQATAVVVLWSKLSVGSRYVKDEAGLALDLKKLVPVLTESVQLPLRFRNIHAHTLTEWTQTPPGPDYHLLVRDIQSKLRSASAIPTRTASDGTAPATQNPQGPIGTSPQHPDAISGQWFGEWTSVQKGRLHRGHLTIPKLTRFQGIATLDISYERNGKETQLQEILQATFLAGTLTLVGQSYEYINQGNSIRYHLDTFSLRLSSDGLQLEGTVGLHHGERSVRFSRSVR